jgi:uncharacterized protein DUF6883
MPFPGAGQAVVPNDKLFQYLLSPMHPVGGPKAAWFASIGYTAENAATLAADLIRVANSGESFVSKPSTFGVKYEVAGEIGCPGFRPARATTVWIVSGNDPPRLITAYPAG